MLRSTCWCASCGSWESKTIVVSKSEAEPQADSYLPGFRGLSSRLLNQSFLNQNLHAGRSDHGKDPGPDRFL
jgi:hypothetical protein